MLYATCSSTDALAIADRIAVIDRGIVQQVGTASEVFERPETVAVAGFVGQDPMNLIPAVHRDGFAHVGGLRVKVGSAQAEALTSDRVLIGLRSEDLGLGGDASATAAMTAVAVLIRDDGRDYHVHARTEGPDGPIDLVVRIPRGAPPVRGENLLVTANIGAAHLFDAGTGRRLPD
jgi:multiple sugar transport system ATP-binding protein